jgi:hypothetical protein
MTSFLAIAWITIAIAAFPAFYDLLQWWPVMQETLRSWPNEQAQDITPDREPARSRWIEKFKKLLIPVCDLQSITGIAIIIAGFSQIQSISYYHEQLVIGYWWLTLNSFWAARVDYMDEDKKDDPVRLLMRRVTILISCILGVTFQTYINVREEREWDSQSGPCYRWSDPTSNWPWVGGTAFYSLILILLIIPATKPLLPWYIGKTEKLQECAISWFRESCQIFVRNQVPPKTKPLIQAKDVIKVASSAICLVLCWLLLQLVAVTSYGDGFYPLFLILYVLFNVRNTYDIISLKIYNQDLVGDEGKWSFGQVLPMALMLVIVFHAVDTFRSKQCTPHLVLRCILLMWPC